MCAKDYIEMKDAELLPVDRPTVALVRDRNHYVWDTVNGFNGEPHTKMSSLRTALDMVWAMFCTTGEGTIIFPKERQ